MMLEIQETNKRREREKEEKSRIASIRNYKDIESEMEDNEPIKEERSEDEESSTPGIAESAKLPINPAYGEEKYFRETQGTE